MPKLEIDNTVCQAHGRCYALAPKLVEADEEGYGTVTPAGFDLAPEDLALADEIVGTCPEAAITLLRS